MAASERRNHIKSTMALTTKTTYYGNCHCGRYRFQVVVPKIQTAIVCSCSLCRIKSYLWLVPGRVGFSVLRDEGCLINYESYALRDKFCGFCGTGVLGEHTSGPLQGVVCVNIRAIQGVSPFELESSTTVVDTPEPMNSSRPTETRMRFPPHPSAQHVFSCHCTKVSAELLVPIRGQELKEDNCSSCVRTGFIGVYPTKDQVKLHGQEHTVEYLYGRRYTGITFCKICGVYVFSIVHGPPLSIFDGVPTERRDHVMYIYQKNINLQPLNVRAMEGVDMGCLEVNRRDEGTEGYELDESS
ncbi:Mss4-like protein [Nemania sp. FL0031]|nr:Mss4-like protein [Nemania sp. FL0031]